MVLRSDETDQAAQHKADKERERAVPEVGNVVKSEVDKMSLRRGVSVGWPGCCIGHCQVGPAGAAVLYGGGHQWAEPGVVVGPLLPSNHLTKPRPEDSRQRTDQA